MRVVLVIFKHGINFWDLRSRCEAVIVVLQGLMSSKVN